MRRLLDLGARARAFQAVDLPRGGVDAGVFGYYAGLVNEPRAVFKGSTTTVPAP